MMTCLTYLLKFFYFDFIIIFALLINNFNLYLPLLFNSLFDNYSNSNYYIECLTISRFSSFCSQIFSNCFSSTYEKLAQLLNSHNSIPPDHNCLIGPFLHQNCLQTHLMKVMQPKQFICFTKYMIKVFGYAGPQMTILQVFQHFRYQLHFQSPHSM